jgi:hypothetical protein
VAKRKDRHLEMLPMEGLPDLPKPAQQTPLALSSYDLFGLPANSAEWGRWGKAHALLKEAQVSAAELPWLTGAYLQKFPGAAMTLMAVATRVGELRKWIGMGNPSTDELARQARWAGQIARARAAQEEE